MTCGYSNIAVKDKLLVVKMETFKHLISALVSGVGAEKPPPAVLLVLLLLPPLHMHLPFLWKYEIQICHFLEFDITPCSTRHSLRLPS
jgi:hypothetical protein